MATGCVRAGTHAHESLQKRRKGEWLVTREITVTRTMNKSKILNQLLKKGQNRCAIRVKVSSTAKMMVKVISRTVNSSCGPLWRISSCTMETVEESARPESTETARHPQVVSAGKRTI